MALLSALLPALTAACASNVESETGSTSSASAGTSMATGGVGGASPTTTGGSGKSCGGFAGETCADNEFCDYPDDLCGAADGSGTCVPRPDACPDVIDPMCACNGKSYENACDAAAKGVDVSTVGGCKTPKGYFACGPTFCPTGMAYCMHSVSDVGGEPDSYSCRELPTACGSAPSCACLAGVPCGESCAADPGGTLTVTCLGG